MGRFGRVLQRAESELRVPGARRARVLEEVAQDLDDAYRAYRARGMGEEEAVRRAERLLGLSEPAVAELERVHGTWYGRVVRRFSLRGAHRFERAVLVGLTLLAMGLVTGGLVASGGPGAGALPVGSLLAVFAAMMVLLAGDWLADLRGALPGASPFVPMVALAAAALATGGLGALREMWRLAAWEVGGRSATPAVAVAVAIGRGAEVLALAVVVALFGLVAGFHLRSRRRAAEWRRPAMRHGESAEVASGGTNDSSEEEAES
jgi:hypothetical protein